MRLRQMAVAFLLNEEQEVLFLQKEQKSTFLAGLLVPIGGHMEETEINEPQKACLREVQEETGLKGESIEKLKLRYIVHRIKGSHEIRIQYVFFGTVSKNSTLIKSDEGSLKWIGYKDIPNHNVTATTIEIAKHYKEIAKYNEAVYVGSMKSEKGNPEITWGLLEDWELRD